MVEKLLKCPNCGANATNHQNCEYCGSLLIRFVDKGISLQMPPAKIYDKSLYLPGVHDAVTAHWQRHESAPHAVVITTLYPLNYEESPIQVLSNDSGDVMCMDIFLQNADQIAKLKRFHDYLLLDVREDSGNELLASIDFGNDIEYATQFISIFLKEIYNHPINEPVKWQIDDNVMDENVNPGENVNSGEIINLIKQLFSSIIQLWKKNF